MEKFRKKTLHRVWCLSFCFAIIAVAFVVAGLHRVGVDSSALSHLADFTQGVNFGLLMSGGLIGLVRIIRLIGCLRDEKKLRIEYIKHTDERTREIEEKSSSFACFVTSMVLLLGVVVFGFFNEAIAVTLLAALGVLLISKVSSKLFYRHSI